MVQLLHLCGIICNFRIKIHQIVFKLRAFVCKSLFSRITSACATDLKKNDLNICTASTFHNFCIIVGIKL